MEVARDLSREAEKAGARRPVLDSPGQDRSQFADRLQPEVAVHHPAVAGGPIPEP